MNLRTIVYSLFSILPVAGVWGAEIITINPIEGDATAEIQRAIDRVASYNGKPVTVKFVPGNYNISRDSSSRHLYYISNTSSERENPDQTKHIGLWLKGLRNVTLDGDGAWLITHGEMTPIVIDDCENIKIENFTITAADPSVPEFKVISVSNRNVVAEISSPSKFEIVDGNFVWTGEGWSFGMGVNKIGYQDLAQVYYPDKDVTYRCDSPFRGCKRAVRLDDNVVRFEYDQAPQLHPGEIYQMRHGVRNEACALINLSRNVTVSNVEFNFLGNFGLVGQFSENLTYRNIRCRPQPGSGRTDAGFADFVQMSGCKGLIKISDSRFEGAHDDPINIHGTHLKVVASPQPDRLIVRFCHDQSFGFQPFYKGDKVEIVDRHTLNCFMSAMVKEVKQIDNYQFEIRLNRNLSQLPAGYSVEDFAVENVTYTPDVEITGNYFSRTPTRGILITTRGKSLIADNLFYRIPMSAILVSNDARGWYESGPVKDLTIRRNCFIECGSPVIDVWPEIDRYDKPVHSGINIEANRFRMKSGKAVRLKAADDVNITTNVFELVGEYSANIEQMIENENTSDLNVENNLIISVP